MLLLLPGDTSWTTEADFRVGFRGGTLWRRKAGKHAEEDIVNSSRLQSHNQRSYSSARGSEATLRGFVPLLSDVLAVVMGPCT